jgi:DNA-directed RNA polymerase subunit RPC12/RpoP
MELVTLKTYHSSLEAHHDRIKLENEGIPCVIFDEQSIHTVPLYDLAVGGMRLKVRDEDVVDALGILSKVNQSSGNDVIQCPKCHSSNVKLRWGIKDIIGIFLSLLYLTGSKRKHTTYKCSRCKNFFKMQIS